MAKTERWQKYEAVILSRNQAQVRENWAALIEFEQRNGGEEFMLVNLRYIAGYYGKDAFGMRLWELFISPELEDAH